MKEMNRVEKAARQEGVVLFGAVSLGIVSAAGLEGREGGLGEGISRLGRSSLEA